MARVGATRRRPVRRLSAAPDADLLAWPATLPAVAHVLRAGLDLGPVTVLVGENGSGKSTLVEGIALAFGLSSEGGSTMARHTTRETESQLWRSLLLTRDAGASRWGFFLRAETMHGFYTYLEEHPGGADPVFHEMSHGESFLELLGTSRFSGDGLYLLDEPESALSFTGCLALVDRLHTIGSRPGAQAVVATHSPIVASVPGATLLEVGDWGVRESAWEDLDLVRHWRSFLDEPQRYLRHVI